MELQHGMGSEAWLTNTPAFELFLESENCFVGFPLMDKFAVFHV